jgi:hypothetical protein
VQSRTRLIACLLAVDAGVVSADDTPNPGEQPPPAISGAEPTLTETTAQDVQGAPLPGNESGRIDPPAKDSTARVVARYALFVPKVAWELVNAPIRTAIWADEYYALTPLYYSLFYNHDQTLSVTPTATYATGWGLTAGARFLATDLMGEREHLLISASIGQTYRSEVIGEIDSGNRFGRVRLELGADFNRRPNVPFWGIGNNDRVTAQPMDVDAFNDNVAFQTEYRDQTSRVYGVVHTELTDTLYVDAAISAANLLTNPSVNTGGQPSVQQVFMPSTLTGFGVGVNHVYPELTLIWDTRRTHSRWEPPTATSLGSLVMLYAGEAFQDRNLSAFFHYGFDLQQFFRLGVLPKVLTARLHGEAVSGNLNQVPFQELPMLGGDTYLRGYPYARFQDRLAAVATLQYGWDLSLYADAFLFVDAGRVYHEYSELSVSDLKCGFGVGINLHSDRSFLVVGTLGTSIDGGVVVTAAFNPVFENHRRWR